jgi:hypothetical protein
MTKKHFIAMADAIRHHNHKSEQSGGMYGEPFTMSQIATLGQLCKSQNPNFNPERWRDYIAGKCGPNGGEIKLDADGLSKH